MLVAAGGKPAVGGAHHSDSASDSSREEEERVPNPEPLRSPGVVQQSTHLQAQYSAPDFTDDRFVPVCVRVHVCVFVFDNSFLLQDLGARQRAQAEHKPRDPVPESHPAGVLSSAHGPESPRCAFFLFPLEEVESQELEDPESGLSRKQESKRGVVSTKESSRGE